jgi:hypothetical protein
MTFGEIKAEVFKRLRESSTSPVFWTEDDVGDAINEGLGEISDSSEWYERVKVVNLLKSRPYYDVYAFLDRCFLRIDAAYNTTTSRWLTHEHHSNLDSGDNRWEMRVAEPDRLLFRGIRWLSYWPYKGTPTGTIRQYFVSIPKTLCDDADVPGFPEQFHYGLVDYAFYDLMSQDGETDQALEAWKAYQGYDQGLTAWVNKRAAIPYRGGNAPSALGS